MSFKRWLVCPWCQEGEVTKGEWLRHEGKELWVYNYDCGTQYIDQYKAKDKNKGWIKTCRRKKSKWDSLLKPLSELRGEKK